MSNERYYLGCFLPATVEVGPLDTNTTQYFNLADYASTVATSVSDAVRYIKINLGSAAGEVTDYYYYGGAFTSYASGQGPFKDTAPSDVTVYSNAYSASVILGSPAIIHCNTAIASPWLRAYLTVSEAMPLACQEIPNTYTRSSYAEDIVDNSETLNLDDGRNIKVASGPLGLRVSMSWQWPAVDGLKDRLNSIIQKAAEQPAPLIYYVIEGTSVKECRVIWPDAYNKVQETEIGLLTLSLTGSVSK